ncbi:HD-GYP domain-containing protein (c-di-GMP phosphodiesterase class II) [Natranaerovirga pectinivora]|uniref:HD-GYP domain-containing protein (C-di-GMP phosphodiesterase class II) n=1 Tax=Natranaerovirga pectinivora TaxID=682400 RepID=A0A4V2V0E1_9FIRM|nr:HD-GYP domain-containing protein [Natranaerovirga pectinivora]TCT15540.1 HD-GYP domain-containing protein (c-di-GMP phosphodiesterase class II) [Natranaerovirga pectinivora]
MRYVPIDNVTEGMVIGKSLFDLQQQLLLREGSEIKRAYIHKIQSLGIQGLYIQDEVSKEIEIKDVISDTLRHKAVNAIKNVCIFSEQDLKKNSKTSFKDMKNIVKNIVEDIISNKDTIINLIDLKNYDDYTYYHSVNVAVISIVMGISYGLNKDRLIELGLGAVLHDIGKMFIDKQILNKKGVLTEYEFEELKKHPEIGYKYLKETFDIPIASYVGVLQHHERYDGKGYPNQKSGKEISLYGRIIAIADVYDALISNRPYRGALVPSEAMEYIMGNGNALFDTNLIRLFVTKVAPYPIGLTVKLSNGLTGIVVENYEDACMRPKIKIIKDEKNNAIEPYSISLRSETQYRNVTIQEIV